MRVILDTNLWISFLISDSYEKLDPILLNNDCTILFSEELLAEFIEVSSRPKIQKFISDELLHELLESMSEVVELVSVSSLVTACRDPKDNFLLSLALDGKADYLLTGDKDLLVLGHFYQTRIQKISDFLNEISE